jgi:hypothetical protein
MRLLVLPRPCGLSLCVLGEVCESRGITMFAALLLLKPLMCMPVEQDRRAHPSPAGMVLVVGQQRLARLECIMRAQNTPALG